MSKSDVERQINDQLTKTVGSKPDSVSCPGDLGGTVGATMRCQITAGGASIGTTVTVTSVDNEAVKFDIKVDDAAAPSSSTTVTTAAP